MVMVVAHNVPRNVYEEKIYNKKRFYIGLLITGTPVISHNLIKSNENWLTQN